MAAGVKAASFSAGGNFAFGKDVSPASYYNTPGIASPANSHKHPFAKSVGDGNRTGTPSSSKSNKRHPLQNTLRNIDTGMSSYTSTTTIPAASSTGSESRRARLHKRDSSGSSLPGQISGFRSQSTTPYSTYEDPFPDIHETTPTSSTPKIKPYLRKISGNKDDHEDQGRLDLSKSVSETGGPLTGLGIQDYGSRTVSDSSFSHSGRRTTHARTTSVGSTISTGSGSFRPTQPFVHPMRQTPYRPYTPPTTDASSLDEDEVRESSDIVTDDDVRLSQSSRNRSMSIPVSSTPQIAPTPLSQSYTAADLGYVPKLTSSSQTNLSIKSGRSVKSSRSKLNRSRTDTNISAEFVPSPSSRTSLDKTISFVSRRSETDPQTRDDRIRAARRKFDEKEANKDRKVEKQALKRRETEEAKMAKAQDKQRRKSEQSEHVRRKSEASERSRLTKLNDGKKGRSNMDKVEGLRRSSRDDAGVTALPGERRMIEVSEKGSGKEKSRSGFANFFRSCNCGKAD